MAISPLMLRYMQHPLICDACGAAIYDLRLIKYRRFNPRTAQMEIVRQWVCVDCWSEVQSITWQDDANATSTPTAGNTDETASSP